MTEAPGRVTAEDGSRFYPWVDPETGVEHQFWSVTTALSMKHKDALKFWAAGLSSDRAMENLPKLIASQRVDPCGRAHARTEPFGCEQCPECVRRWLALFHLGETARRAREGSAMHTGLEAWIKTGVMPPAINLAQPYIEEFPKIAEMLPPYIAQFAQWVADFGIEPSDFAASEMKVFNTVHRYGGTLDGILRLKARNARAAKMVARILGRQAGECLVVLDLKTSESDKKALYSEHPLQMAPYRWANMCQPVKTDSTLFPMPSTHGAVVLQIRPDGYTFEPVVTDEDTFRTFLNYLSAFIWEVEHSKASVRIDSFPVPEGFTWPPPADTPRTPEEFPPGAGAPPAASDQGAPPAKKAAPRKRATKKAAPPANGQAAPQPDSPGGSARVASATLASIHGTGGPSRARGDTLRDDDIPF